MLEFRIAVSELDYGAVAEMLLPVIREKAEPSGNRAVKVLLGRQQLQGQVH